VTKRVLASSGRVLKPLRIDAAGFRKAQLTETVVTLSREVLPRN
jgi:hypothetical protein